MDLRDILNLIAIIVGPVIAVFIGQHLQKSSEKRKDKMSIFKTLMTARLYGLTTDSVHALNLIDIVFVKDKSVRAAWSRLFEAYSSAEQSEQMVTKRTDLMYKLLEEMAKNLGYKNKITWETIQNPYIPKFMVDSLRNQSQSQQDYSSLLRNINELIPKNQNPEEPK